MCGVFGIVSRVGNGAFPSGVGAAMQALFRLSESRGKEAAGLVVRAGDEFTVYKEPRAAHEMMRSKSFRRTVSPTLSLAQSQGAALIGHSRLVTDGDRDLNTNNQPVTYNDVVGVHNGIVVNHGELWRRNPDLKRQFEVDSEVLFALIHQQLAAGHGVGQTVATVLDRVRGQVTMACFLATHERLLLATNNGSLYILEDRENGVFIFSSERYILRQALKQGHFPHACQDSNIEHIPPGEGVVVDIATAAASRLQSGPADWVLQTRTPPPIVDRSPQFPPLPKRPQHPSNDVLLERFPHQSLTHALRRCSRCVLPDSMPFITFDDEGVCSYCRAYQQSTPLGANALEEVVAPHRKQGSQPDCIVGVSGGRDSIYGLHYIKQELGMTPLAYTYDWGMVTDNARRNISRICGDLGIEHILVSADIVAKRENIRKNVTAWLARPNLGAVPLFMAGDKAYFHYLNEVKSQAGVDLTFLCENLLERTDFKTGFAGVPPAFHDADHVYTMGMTNKLRLLGFYGSQFLTNPRYLNGSLLDSAKAFAYYYLIKRQYTNLYRYVQWEENKVSSTIVDQYDFELAPDTQSTWRIGDGTSAFYNYIYYTIAGLTENDTLRSNQIREGVLSRSQALKYIDIENRPRFDTIKWYLDTLKLDMDLIAVLERIHSVPKRYRTLLDDSDDR